MAKRGRLLILILIRRKEKKRRQESVGSVDVNPEDLENINTQYNRKERKQGGKRKTLRA